MKVENFEQSACIHDSGLSEEIYNMALVCGEHEGIIDPDGGMVDWLLDLRIPLLNGSIAGKLGKFIADRLRMAGCRQIAGYGFGGNAMVCAAVNADGYPHLLGGFIRPRRKPHGRQRLIEGPLDSRLPVVLLDDLLNSGSTALHALTQLRNEGFQVIGCFTVCEFTWGEGRARLEKEGLWVDTLMELTLNSENTGSSDSAVRG
ncbi:MAG: orotate phosphoribosyltransferase [Bacteroidetes bacterium]|nr:orotate phosphoribosyltransferase [Bacteroidota bacterium]MCY4204447.1 orotate phosphoribosyltransferase [Bacteroidota bacterium]